MHVPPSAVGFTPPPGPLPLPQKTTRQHPDAGNDALLKSIGNNAYVQLLTPAQKVEYTAKINQIVAKAQENQTAQASAVLRKCREIQANASYALDLMSAQKDLDAATLNWDAIQKQKEEQNLQRIAKLAGAAGQMASGICDFSAGAKGLKDLKSLQSVRDKTQSKEQEINLEHGKLAADRQKAAKLREELDALKLSSQAEGSTSVDPKLQAKIDAKRNELNTTTKAILDRKDAINRKGAELEALQTEEKQWVEAVQTNDSVMALCRGLGMFLQGVGGTVGAEVEYQGNLKKNEAEQNRILASYISDLEHRLQTMAQDNKTSADKSRESDVQLRMPPPRA